MGTTNAEKPLIDVPGGTCAPPGAIMLNVSNNQLKKYLLTIKGETMSGFYHRSEVTRPFSGKIIKKWGAETFELFDELRSKFIKKGKIKGTEAKKVVNHSIELILQPATSQTEIKFLVVIDKEKKIANLNCTMFYKAGEKVHPISGPCTGLIEGEVSGTYQEK